jgi:gas vesicle protein
MPVYFIGNDKGQIKIGYSKDPPSRLSALQTASPHPLKLLALKPGGADVEAELHTKYSNCRLEGEWFQLTDELQVEIEIIQNVYPIESYLTLSEKDRVIYDDALAEWSSAVNKLHKEYDSKIEELEEEIEQLESERDAKEEELDRIFEEKTKGIYPWWLENK